MVSIILVSHSKQITLGLKSLINQMCPAVDVIAIGGCGDNHIQLGTDPVQILEALELVENEIGLIFFDIGSSFISTNLALEMIDTDKHFYLIDAPLVEGSFMASVAISTGTPIDDILKQLESYKLNKIT